MRAARAAALALVVALGPADAATTSALDPLAAAVAARRSIATGAKRRALDRVAARIAAPSTTLADDMAAARRVGVALSRGIPRDPQFRPLFASGVAALTASADAERLRLAAWSGTLGDADREATLDRALGRLARSFDRAADARGETLRLRPLRAACLRVEATLASLGLSGEPPAAPPAMPDFHLPDVNPASPTHGRRISPRDLLGEVGAWYFGHAT